MEILIAIYGGTRDQRIINVTIDPEGNINVCTKFHANPSSSYITNILALDSIWLTRLAVTEKKKFY